MEQNAGRGQREERLRSPHGLNHHNGPRCWLLRITGPKVIGGVAQQHANLIFRMLCGQGMQDAPANVSCRAGPALAMNDAVCLQRVRSLPTEAPLCSYSYSKKEK